MPYGQGKMIGDTVDPRLFLQDYSGFADAANTRAKGIASIGQGIGGLIGDYKEKKKQQSEQEKEIKRADSIAGMIEKQLPDLAGDVAPLRMQLNDKNIPLRDRHAAAQSINGILNLGIEVKKLQIDKEATMARLAPRPRQANLTPVSVPRSDGSSVMMLLDKTTGTFVQPDFGDGGQIPQSSGATTDINDPSQWNADPTLDALSPDMIDIPGQPVAFPQESQGASPPFMLPQERVAQQISSAANMQMNPPAGTTGPFDASGNYIEAAADMKVRPQAQQQQVAATTEQVSPKLGVQPAKQQKGQGTPLTQEQIAQIQAQNGKVSGYIGEGGQFIATSVDFGQPKAGMKIGYDAQGRMVFEQGPGVTSEKQERVEAARKASSIESIRILASAAEDILSKESIMAEGPVSALAGSLLAKGLPASEQGQLENSVDTFNIQSAKGSLLQMRASSPTAGAAGNMTEKEWPIFQSKFVKLFPGMDKEQRIKGVKLNLLNSYEAVNGMPQDVIKALDAGKISQDDFNSYVDGYSMVRDVARVGPEGVPGKATGWTRFNQNLLKKYTGAGKQPAQQAGQPVSDEVDALEQKRAETLRKFGIQR